VILCDAIDDWVASLIADVEVSGLCRANDWHVLSCGLVGVHAWRLMTFAFMFSLISFVSYLVMTELYYTVTGKKRPP